MDATGVGAAVRDMLANLRVLLEKRMLEIAVTGSAADALRTELLRWGRRSAHDDLAPDPCPSSSLRCVDEMDLRPAEGSLWSEEW